MRAEDENALFLEELFRESEERRIAAEAIYDALVKTKRLRKAGAITLRCPNKRRCGLVVLIETPAGLIVHTPRYRLSPERNQQTSSEDGRKANTIDGDRRWKAQTGYLTAFGSIPLRCDHLDTQMSREDAIALATTGEQDPIWSPEAGIREQP